jgi:hypothetical protein
LPRYELLLRELLKETPEDHDEYEDVKTALDKMTKTNIFINEGLKEENPRAVFELVNLMKNAGSAPDLVVLGRGLIRKLFQTSTLA